MASAPRIGVSQSSGFPGVHPAIKLLLLNERDFDSLNLKLVPFASGFRFPVSITNAGDDRLFVVEKSGIIKILLPNGSTLGTPFLNISDRVDSSEGEEGLLGLAFHPGFSSATLANKVFFVNYTHTDTSQTPQVRMTRISRFNLVSASLADPASEEILLTVEQPAGNHNAGDIHFGPDGYLYIPLGDGGGAARANSQDNGTILGAVSRIDVDNGSGKAADCFGLGTGNYKVPNDNPARPAGDCDEIWASGLRNPWRSSFDSRTGDYYIGDVGQTKREEIDVQLAGSGGNQNYGWPCYEGNIEFDTSGCAPRNSYTFPVFSYAHSASDCTSLTGGYVYRGSRYPRLVGRYLFTDFCTGDWWDMYRNNQGVWTVTRHTNLRSLDGITTFGQGSNGELYVGRGIGTIYHVRSAN